MSIKYLKNSLEELLINELGLWRLGSVDIPSIAIVPPLASQISSFSTSGVECLIYQKPTIKPIELIGGFVEERFYRISLTQYNRDKTLENAQELLNLTFENLQYQEKIQKELIVKTESQIELEQASILIPDRDFNDPFLFSRITEIVDEFYL